MSIDILSLLSPFHNIGSEAIGPLESFRGHRSILSCNQFSHEISPILICSLIFLLLVFFLHTKWCKYHLSAIIFRSAIFKVKILLWQSPLNRIQSIYHSSIHFNEISNCFNSMLDRIYAFYLTSKATGFNQKISNYQLLDLENIKWHSALGFFCSHFEQ